MIQMLGAVAPLAKILFNTIEKSVPDKDLQEKLKAQLQTQLLQSNCLNCDFFDLDDIFQAAIALCRHLWDCVAMLDVKHMHVEGSLPRCIRFLIQANLPTSTPIRHVYLRHAAKLRPDWSLPQTLQTSQQVVETKV